GAVQLQTVVMAVRRTTTGWAIDCENPERRWTECVAAVISALPAEALASLDFEGLPARERLSSLREIQHPPVVSVFTGFRRSKVRHPLDGFGALVPEVERGSILGILFSSTLFPGRAPDGHVALTSFVGGTRQPELAGMEDGEI